MSHLLDFDLLTFMKQHHLCIRDLFQKETLLNCHLSEEMIDCLLLFLSVDRVLL